MTLNQIAVLASKGILPPLSSQKHNSDYAEHFK